MKIESTNKKIEESSLDVADGWVGTWRRDNGGVIV